MTVSTMLDVGPYTRPFIDSVLINRPDMISSDLDSKAVVKRLKPLPIFQVLIVSSPST